MKENKNNTSVILFVNLFYIYFFNNFAKDPTKNKNNQFNSTLNAIIINKDFNNTNCTK